MRLSEHKESIIVNTLREKLGTDAACLDYMNLPPQYFLKSTRPQKITHYNSINSLAVMSSNLSGKGISEAKLLKAKDELHATGGWLSFSIPNLNEGEEDPIEIIPKNAAFFVAQIKKGNEHLNKFIQETNNEEFKMPQKERSYRSRLLKERTRSFQIDDDFYSRILEKLSSTQSELVRKKKQIMSKLLKNSTTVTMPITEQASISVDCLKPEFADAAQELIQQGYTLAFIKADQPENKMQ